MAIATVLVAFILSGCAFNVVRLHQEPATLQPAASSSGAVWTLQEEVKVVLVEGWAAVLKKGTTWRLDGKIGQGDVLKTRDQIVTVEASNMYEAEPVVSDGKVVGFFLVVQKTFTPADPPKALTLTSTLTSNNE